MSKEELIGKALQAFLTGAKVVGEEGNKVINEALNYLLFSSILDIGKQLAWGILVFGIVKIINLINKAGIYTTENDILKCEEEIKLIKNGKKNSYLDIDELEIKIGRRKMEIAHSNTIKTAIVAIVIFVYSLWTVEQLRPIGKILIAPRLTLIQEGTNIINGLKQFEKVEKK